MFRPRTRKAVLKEIGDNAKWLASLITCEGCPRKWRVTLVLPDGTRLPGTRLRRFPNRSIWLGKDGVIRISVDTWRNSREQVYCFRAPLNRQRLTRLEFVNNALKSEIEKLSTTVHA